MCSLDISRVYTKRFKSIFSMGVHTHLDQLIQRDVSCALDISRVYTKRYINSTDRLCRRVLRIQWAVCNPWIQAVATKRTQIQYPIRTGRVRCLRQDIKTMRVPCASEIPNAKVIAFTLHYKMTRKREIRKLTYGGGLQTIVWACVWVFRRQTGLLWEYYYRNLNFALNKFVFILRNLIDSGGVSKTLNRLWRGV